MSAFTTDFGSRYAPRSASSGTMHDIADMGRRMVRDLERFLTVELPKPTRGTGLLRANRREGGSSQIRPIE
jgi:hypothetical protein